MTTAVLARMGICADVDHLCQSDWRHLCGDRQAPCQACEFVATEMPWAPWFDWYYVEMMKCAQKRGCQHEDWWAHYVGEPNQQRRFVMKIFNKNL